MRKAPLQACRTLTRFPVKFKGFLLILRAWGRGLGTAALVRGLLLGVPPPHTHWEALNEKDLGGPLPPEGQHPPARPGEGQGECSWHPSPSEATCRGHPASPPTPSSPRGTSFQTACGCPSRPRARLPVAPDPGPPAPPKAPKARRADSLRCPLKPPLHFHQPRSRCRFSGSTPESLPASLRAHVSPATKLRPRPQKLADPAGESTLWFTTSAGSGRHRGG